MRQNKSIERLHSHRGKLLINHLASPSAAGIKAQLATYHIFHFDWF